MTGVVFVERYYSTFICESHSMQNSKSCLSRTTVSDAMTYCTTYIPSAVGSVLVAALVRKARPRWHGGSVE